MVEDIHLFIEDNEVEFNEVPEVLLNYAITDYSNPTVVKNSFSKTITVPGTPKNNEIFGHIWNIERIQGSSSFNPSKRTNFELYSNGGHMVESGYIRLDNVTYDGKEYKYSVTLFGGLGDFLYGLSQTDAGSERELADLIYTDKPDPDSELDFTISKDAVNDAWRQLMVEAHSDDKWNVINFIPAYNGKPDNIDSDKVLVNTDGYSGTTVLQASNGDVPFIGFIKNYGDGSTTYGTVNGWALAETGIELNEWETRDLRSYNQRPCIRVKSIIDAICDTRNNGGYTVNLDSDFFHTDNPYYNNAFMTLPMLDAIAKSGSSSTTELHTARKTVMNTYYEEYTLSASTQFSPQAASYTYEFNFDVSCNSFPTTAYSQYQYTSAYYDGDVKYGGYVLQLVGYNTNDEICCCSNAYILTSEVNGTYLTSDKYYYNRGWTGPAYSIIPVLGKFNYRNGADSGNTRFYRWETPVSLTMDNNGNYLSKIKLIVDSVADLRSVQAGGTTSVSYGDRRRKLYNGTTSNSRIGVSPLHSGGTLTVVASEESEMSSYATITKKNLLSVGCSPADFLLSYCKMFGLYLVKDVNTKTVDILCRNNYFINETVNIDDKIDYSMDIINKPITFNSKWYEFAYQDGEGEWLNRYKSNYGGEPGRMMIDTGYNFDSNTNDLLKDTKFKNAIDGLEKSNRYSLRMQYVNGITAYTPTFLYTPVTYKLFSSSGGDFSLPVKQYSTYSEGFFNNLRLYDWFPKLQFHNAEGEPTNGDMCLVFYKGGKTLQTYVGSSWEYPRLYLTDDIADMFTCNDGPCYMWTNTEYKGNERIAIEVHKLPIFERYTGDGYINKTWDFGRVRELYTPNLTYSSSDPTVYERYQKRYISDLYDVNTRTVTCYVKFNGFVDQSAIRKFYWFNNSLWVLNKIMDENIIGNRPVKCEFVKVNDKSNYLHNPNYTEDIWLRTYGVGDGIPNTGGTFTLEIDVTNDAHWQLECSAALHPSQYSGYGDTTINVTVDNNISLGRTLYVGAFVGESADSISVDIFQYGSTLSIMRNGGGDIPSSGGTASFTITGNAYWNAYSTEDYVTVSPSSGMGAAIVTATFSSNTGESPREANVFFSAQPIWKYPERFAIKQQAGVQKITCSPTEYTAATSGETFNVTVSASTSWNTSFRPSWMTSSPSSGSSGTTIVAVTVLPCTGETGHSQPIEFMAENETEAQCWITQYAE